MSPIHVEESIVDISPAQPVAAGEGFGCYWPAMQVEQANWLAERMERPWARGDGGNHLAAIIPTGFEAYARILHPAYICYDRQEMSWQTVARLHRRQSHPLMQWPAISNQVETGETLPGLREPRLGSLPGKQIAALARTLRNFSSSAEDCRFAVWEGFGGLRAEEQWPRAAYLRLPGRNCWLLRGTIEAVLCSVLLGSEQSPSIWWPLDRAWCVVTEVDLPCSYVGGSKACIDCLLADNHLEAWTAGPEDRIDIGADQVNQRSNDGRA